MVVASIAVYLLAFVTLSLVAAIFFAAVAHAYMVLAGKPLGKAKAHHEHRKANEPHKRRNVVQHRPAPKKKREQAHPSHAPPHRQRPEATSGFIPHIIIQSGPPLAKLQHCDATGNLPTGTVRLNT